MKLIYLLLVTVLFSGCQRDMNRNEIGDVDFIRIMGIDRAEEFTVSILFEKDKKPQIKKATAKTVFEAYEEIADKCDKPITLAHTKYFIINAKTPGENIEEFLDFITRDEKVKTDVAVYVTKTGSAEEFLNSSDKISEKLDFFSRKILFYSTKQSNTLTDLYNPDITAFLPTVAVGEDSVMSDGYAIVQGMQVKAFADERISVGLNFVGDRVRSGGIFTPSAGMVIYDSKTDIKDSELNIYFMTNIKEITGESDFRDMNYISELTAQQNEYVYKAVRSAAGFLEENNIRYPDKYWDKEKITVKSKITGTFDIE